MLMLIVRFVSDWSLYAAGDEAAFTEQVAMGLQQKGLARVKGPVEESQPQLELQLHSSVAAIPMPAVDEKQRRK
jgi:hypothetical protein